MGYRHLTCGVVGPEGLRQYSELNGLRRKPARAATYMNQWIARAFVNRTRLTLPHQNGNALRCLTWGRRAVSGQTRSARAQRLPCRTARLAA